MRYVLAITAALATPAAAQSFTFPNGVTLQGQPKPAPFFGFSVRPLQPPPPAPVIKPPVVVSPPVPPVVVVTPPTVVKPPIIPVLPPTPPTANKHEHDLDKGKREHEEADREHHDRGDDKDRAVHYGFPANHFWGYRK